MPRPGHSGNGLAHSWPTGADLRRKQRRPGRRLHPLTWLFSVGVFSCYADHLRQGWELLQDCEQPGERLDDGRQPRSFARITDDRLAAAIADYKAGLSSYDLATKYGHHRATIMKHLAQAGVRLRTAKPTDDEITQWRDLHAQRLGFKTIARQVGRNHKTVRKYVARTSSLDSRPTGRRPFRRFQL